jgi:glycosyltransferase involved in cell wall biosynthesis
MITFIIPTRNNLPYLKLAHASIRKYYPDVEIIIYDDGSTDGTREWAEQSDDFEGTTYYAHTDGRQVGHTILYDKAIELADNDIFTIFHADMVCGPNYVENILKHLNPGGVVSATRIEPPLHPAGKEKIVKDFGIYHSDFKSRDFDQYCRQLQSHPSNRDITTKGIFAPWAMYKKDFQAIGGHDKLFSPFPYEDSDIFQRFVLAGYDIKQSRDAFVYHWTCRGHRWTEQVQKDDLFYKLCCVKNQAHFIRKWGHWIENDDLCYPVIHKKYDISVHIKNCKENFISVIEPWFSTTYVDCDINNYIHLVQPGTPFNLTKRVKGYNLSFKDNNDINVLVDGNTLDNEKLKTLLMIPKMIEDSGEIGQMEYEGIEIIITKLENKEPLLINNNSDYYQNQLVPLTKEDPYYTNELFKVFEQVKKNS